MHEDHTSLEQRLESMQQQLHELQRRGSSRSMRFRMFVLGALVALASGAVTVAAQTVADDLRVFSAGSPALASDVNWNFTLLKQWIEHKLGDAKSPVVTMNKALVHQCVGCGSSSAINGTENWGNLVMQGRVISTNSNLHLSPPSGYNVVIEDAYRAAGGTSTGVAGLVVEGDISSQGKTLGNHIRDYVRNNCHLSFGWADGCNGGCAAAPTKWGTTRADGTCTSITGADSECTSSWIGISTDGDVNGDDKFYARLICN